MPRKQPPNINNGLRFGLISDKGNANIWLMVPCALHTPLKTRDWTTWTARPRVGDLDVEQECAQRCIGWSPRPKSSISNIFCSGDFSSEVPSHFFAYHWRTSQTPHMFSREQEPSSGRADRKPAGNMKPSRAEAHHHRNTITFLPDPRLQSYLLLNWLSLLVARM